MYILFSTLIVVDLFSCTMRLSDVKQGPATGLIHIFLQVLQRSGSRLRAHWLPFQRARDMRGPCGTVDRRPEPERNFMALDLGDGVWKSGGRM